MQAGATSPLKHKTTSNWISLLGPLALFASWAIFLTYPLILRLNTHLPLGTEPVGVVPLFNLWTLQWNIGQSLRGYPDYWNAPIFAPTPGTFAFSEIQPLTALLAAPLWLFFQSPAGGYNMVLLLFLTFNGWFAYHLLRTWQAPAGTALLTGLIMQSLPFVAQEMGVLQLLALFGPLWLLLFLSRLLAEGRRKSPRPATVIIAALGLPVTFFTCGYYGLFSLIFVPLAAIFQADIKVFNRRSVAALAAAAALAIALSAPLALAQQRQLVHHNFSRSARIISQNSAHLSDYSQVLPYNVLYGQLLNIRSGSGQRLFPGVVLLALAAVGLLNYKRRRLTLYLATAGSLALLLSLGLNLHLGHWQPYDTLRDLMPGLAQLRSPFRFAAMVQLHLALAAGLGLAFLQRRLAKGRVIALLTTALILLESVAWPLPLLPLPPLTHNASWQQWLQQQKTPTVVMLPFAPSHRVADFKQTVIWMLENKAPHAVLSNGYSGFFPADHAALRRYMLRFPDWAGIEALRQRQVQYVVVHHRLANAPRARQMRRYLPQVWRDEAHDVAIYAVKPRR